MVRVRDRFGGGGWGGGRDRDQGPGQGLGQVRASVGVGAGVKGQGQGEGQGPSRGEGQGPSRGQGLGRFGVAGGSRRLVSLDPRQLGLWGAVRREGLVEDAEGGVVVLRPDLGRPEACGEGQGRRRL